MNYLFIDFESYYSRKEGMDLKTLPIMAYCRDPRFKVHGLAVAIRDGSICWYDAEEGRQFLDGYIDWPNTVVVGQNCIPLDAEVFTKTGWVKLAHIRKNDIVMEWNSGNAVFAPVLGVVQKRVNEMLTWDTQFHRLSYTPEHRVYYSTPQRKDFRVATAEAVSKMSPNNTYIPVSGTYPGESSTFTAVEARLLEAIRADGSIERGHVRFHLKKVRKIERLKALLRENRLGFSEVRSGKEGTVRIGVFGCDHLKSLLSLFKNGKKYDTMSLLNQSLQFREAILEEAKYWDAHSQKDSYGYQLATVDDETAEAFEAIAHFSGWSASRRKVKNHHWREQNIIAVRKKQKVKLVEKAVREKGTFDVGCITVPSGAFFVRYKGRVTVTGNCKFDAFILKNTYGKMAGQYIDTKAMSKAILGKTIKGHSLKDLAEYYGLEPKGQMTCEGVHELSEEEERALASYCKHDVWLTREIFNRLKPEFPEGQYPLMDWTVRTFVDPQLRLNVPLLKETAEKERADKKAKFEALGIDKKVFSSQDKFAALLKERGYEVPMKPSPKKKDENGKPVLIPALAMGDVAFLDMLEDEDEALRTLCEARRAAKSTLIETRADKMVLVGETGPWAFDVELSGADQTHRLSGGPGGGGNPQNLTRDSALRKAVEAGEGKSLVVGDLSGVELRVVAFVTGDRALLHDIQNGIDVYCSYASAFYGFSVTKENYDERHFGKTAELSLQYNSGAETFQGMVRKKTGRSISMDVAERGVKIYRERHSGVVAAWKWMQAAIPDINSPVIKPFGFLPLQIGKGGVILPSGLVMKYPNLRQIDTGRVDRWGKPRMEWVYDVFINRKLQQAKLYGGKFLENICQALAGEICKEAAQPFLPWLTGLVHDEIHLLVPSSLAPHFAKSLEATMSKSPSWFPSMKLAAEVGYGPNWLDSKA